MAKEPDKEKSSALLFVACWVVYMIICMTKTNYTASIAYIVKEGIFSKSSSGIISAAFYFMYALSQFFGGGIADRFSPYKVMLVGIVGSMITNFMLIFSDNFVYVLVIWSITGLIQFGVWPAAARIVAGVLVPEHRRKAGVYITLAIGFGGIMSYLFVTSVLEKFGWGGVFTMNVIMLLAALLIWQFTTIKTESVLMPDAEIITGDKSGSKSDVKFMPLFFSSGLFIVVFFGIAQAMLDNGVKSWVPTMMVESYNLSATWASIQTALMYICNITGIFLLIRIFKKIESPVLTQTLYFLICVPVCAMLLFIGKIPVALVVVLLIISTTVIYAMTNISVRIAAAFVKFGYSGTVSGIINAFVSLGVVIGNGGYGIIAEKYGWGAVTAVWLGICIAAVILGIPFIILWRRFINEKVKEKGEIL